VYYKCTKRKKGCENCSQKAITLKDLEGQIDTIISGIEIMPEFKEWALEALKNDFQYCVETKRAIQQNLQVSIDGTEKKLRKLTEALI